MRPTACGPHGDCGDEPIYVGLRYSTNCLPAISPAVTLNQPLFIAFSIMPVAMPVKTHRFPTRRPFARALTAALVPACVLVTATSADAYVGPGAGFAQLIH